MVVKFPHRDAMASILLITPDQALQDYATQALSAAGHNVTPVSDGDHAMRATFTLPVDIVVADGISPGLADTRGRMESAGRAVSFVFVAAPGASWEPGKLPVKPGDQVVAKPATTKELRSAVAAALNGAPLDDAITDLAGATFDRPGQRVINAGKAAQLTPIEFKLLDRIVAARGAIVSSEQLLASVWGYAPGTGSSEIVRSHLKNLRAKLQAIAAPELVETVPRRGYRLAV
jgi:DNA-binding response OmpR family regulator